MAGLARSTFAILGFASNATSVLRNRPASAAGAGIVSRAGASGVISQASAWRSRWIARACNCETRDSFTPSSAPICFIVTSPK
jgi:hypothetical protein